MLWGSRADYVWAPIDADPESTENFFTPAGRPELEHIRIGRLREESGDAIVDCDVDPADVRTGELELPFNGPVTHHTRLQKRMHSEHGPIATQCQKSATLALTMLT